MTEAEAISVLLGLPRRELLERQCEQMKAAILDADSQGLASGSNWARTSAAHISKSSSGAGECLS